jgi:hypothetical protein
MVQNTIILTAEHNSLFSTFELSLPISPITQPSFTLGQHVATFHNKSMLITNTGKLLLLYIPKTQRHSEQEQMNDTCGKLMHKGMVDRGFSVQLNKADSVLKTHPS